MLFDPPLGGPVWLIIGALVPVILVLAYAWLYVQSMIEKRLAPKDKDDDAAR